jgi:hypothetical protein
MKYLNNFDNWRLDRLNESKDTESRGLSILKSKQGIVNPDNIIKQMSQGVTGKTELKDKSKNQKNIVYMAYFYDGKINLEDIINIFNEYDSLEIKKRVEPIQMSKSVFKIGNKEFVDFLTLSEFIHGETNKYSPSGGSVSKDFVADKKPLWSGNNIDIYEGDHVGKCISYSSGALTGRKYPFCIGQPGNTMYKSYRDTKASTFYYIIDRNRFKKEKDGSVNLDDPLHIVVFDATGLKQNGELRIELTDANNRTGDISEFGKDTKAYIEYLKSKGVPLEKLVNKAKTEKETKEDEAVGRYNGDLNWFKKLTFEFKSSYIGRGHRLTDEQFDFIVKSDELISQYVDTGLKISEHQVNQLSKSDKKTYIRKRKMTDDLSWYEIKILPPEDQDKELDKTINKISSNSDFLDRFIEEVKEKEKKNEIINWLLSRTDLFDKIFIDSYYGSAFIGILLRHCKNENLNDLLIKLLPQIVKLTFEEDFYLNRILEYAQEDSVGKPGKRYDNKNIVDIVWDLLLSNKDFIDKLSKLNSYDLDDIIKHYIEKSDYPEEIPRKLGNLWKKHIQYLDNFGTIMWRITHSQNPDKVVKIYGKIAEDHLRNIDSDGVYNLLNSNYEIIIKLLLSYDVSKDIINDAIKKHNIRYENDINLLEKRQFKKSMIKTMKEL